MVLPTGGGKTSVFTKLAAEIRGPVVILVHRRELATQAANRLREFGVDHGFIMAGMPPKTYARVQIASVQTLVRRKVPPASLVICDEAHLSTAKTWASILEQYPNAKILGCTATPWRLSGKSLADAYDACAVVSTPRELREQGYLCNYVGFSYKTPDLSGVATVGGDYNEKQSAEAMREPTIVNNVVEQWLAHAAHLSTVVFNVTVEHSLEVTAKFKAAGVAAEHLDGETPLEQRRAILARVASGATRVLCNVGVAVEGLDIPRLKCCVLNRPTKSLARAIQMMGRVRRPFEGQTARIHDHAFLMRSHGLPDDERDYTLTTKKPRPASLTTCEKCGAIYRGAVCPQCGEGNAPDVTERLGPKLIDDAEKIEFASGGETAQPKPAARKAPVDVRWNTPGRIIEGVYDSMTTEQGQYGLQKLYTVRTPSRDYRLPGTAHLNLLMSTARIGQRIRVTYLGETLGATYNKRLFRLEVDDGL